METRDERIRTLLPLLALATLSKAESAYEAMFVLKVFLRDGLCGRIVGETDALRSYSKLLLSARVRHLRLHLFQFQL